MIDDVAFVVLDEDAAEVQTLWMGLEEIQKSQLHKVIEEDALRVVYQPLVEVSTQQVFAYEVLVRTTSERYKSPPELFDAAIRDACCGLLGRAIRRLAIDHCPCQPLFLNIHPHEFSEGWLVRPDDPVFEHEYPVWLEITESVPLSHYALCRSVLSEVRSRGIALAVDDLGAGYSNLKYIADLKPEMVKIDRALVMNLNTDRRMQTLVSHIVKLCEELGAKVVAEGIERQDELHAVEDTGAHFVQGYYLARPSFPPPRLLV